MNATLLLDLDDTLLQNDIESFLPNYLGAYSQTVSPYLDPEQFVRTLLSSTRVMTKNLQPDRTLKETFDAVFFPALGLERAAFEQLAEHFYTQVFPRLQSLTQPVPEAVQMVQAALANGNRLAVATNALFPLQAILQRLEWANLPASQYPFQVIASYETFHFAKPEPAYFAEVLARLGWPEGTVVIVGDDLEQDVAPGRSLGLPVFWIEQPGIQPPDGPLAPSASGSIAGLLPWLESAMPEALQPAFSQPPAMQAILRATPAVLDSWRRVLPAEAWRYQPAGVGWSLTQILCHLRDVEQEVNLPRLQLVLSANNPFIAGQDTDRWADERHYQFQDGPQALQDFTAARLQTLEVLEGLSLDDWQRPVRHAIFGSTQLAELVGIMAGHDRLHIRQTHQTLSDCIKLS